MSHIQAIDVGGGTPGKRTKRAWRASGAEHAGTSLREWARSKAREEGDEAEDAALWLASKRSGGTDEQRKERRIRLRERTAANVAAKLARRSKGANKSQQKKKGGGDDSR